MNLLGVLEISGSALRAQRQRAEIHAANMANAETTRTPEGGPYRRQLVVFGARRTGSFSRLLAGFREMYGRGVTVERVLTDRAAPIRRFEPAHPDADGQGYVDYPSINPTEEMVNLMAAARSYQLNVAAVQATKAMIQQSLEILR